VESGDIPTAVDNRYLNLFFNKNKNKKGSKTHYQQIGQYHEIEITLT